MFVELSPLLSSLDWRQPLWLLVAILPLLLWLFLYWKKHLNLTKFADEHLLPWLQVDQQKTFWQTLFSRNSAYVLAWIFFAFSLAGPRVPDASSNSQNEILLDIMMVVDLSQSMKATDIKPSRLRRATLEIYDFLSIAKNIRIGVSVYAARPHLFVPLTTDIKALQFYLHDLDSLKLPTQGSDAGAALAFAKKELQASKTKDSHQQVILWLTDGDFETGSDLKIKSQIEQANASGIHTYILGLGTLEGDAIPLADGTWLESDGQAVLSKMNNQLLEQMSIIGNGVSAKVSDDDTEWNKLYFDGMIASLNTPKHVNTQQWHELFSWVLFPAILFLVMAHFPFKRSHQSKIKTKHLSTTQPSLTALILAFGIFGIISSIVISFPAYATEKKYDTSFEKSVQQGVESYRNTDFSKSKDYFIESVLNSNNAKERGIALHNLGNALFQSGDYANATEVFNDVLRYAPEQEQSQKNQQLSNELNLLLERERIRAKGRGNFASSNDNTPLFDLPEVLPFMLSTKAVNLLKASLPKMPEEEINRLIENGIKHIQLIEGDNDKSLQKIKEQQDYEQARIHFMGLEEQRSNALWKRLFEIEEGFPGKLKKPEIILGVCPW